MANEKPPETLDWVHARSECRLPHVFKELEQGVREDLEAAQSLVPKQYDVKFSLAKTTASRFSAIRVDDPMISVSRTVDFVCTKEVIQVYDYKDQLMCSATLTLNKEGKCRLVVDKEELTQWQFRKMTLEKLFFGPHE